VHVRPVGEGVAAVINSLSEAEQVMRTPRNYTWSEQLDAFALILAEYDRRGTELAAKNAEFADCGLCRQRVFIELNSRCERHRDEDDESW
jgi:predicted Zn-ribbon and HTH transcriptional regulator